jgi:cysteine desulfuration protein SufE
MNSFESCLKKQQQLREIFSTCPTPEARYQKIIDFGRQLPPLSEQHKTPHNLVKGCQSLMYLHSHLSEDRLIFEAYSDALISLGLAALLIYVYSGETPETVLKCPPHYLEDLGVSASLSPSRANGLYSIHLRMKQEALKFLMKQEHQS